MKNKALKAVDTIGNCQRQVVSLGVSQHMHKITNLQIIMQEKTPLSHKVVCFQMLYFKIKSVENFFFLEKLHYFRGTLYM